MGARTRSRLFGKFEIQSDKDKKDNGNNEVRIERKADIARACVMVCIVFIDVMKSVGDDPDGKTKNSS